MTGSCHVSHQILVPGRLPACLQSNQSHGLFHSQSSSSVAKHLAAGSRTIQIMLSLSSFDHVTFELLKLIAYNYNITYN